MICQTLGERCWRNQLASSGLWHLAPQTHGTKNNHWWGWPQSSLRQTVPVIHHYQSSKLSSNCFVTAGHQRALLSVLSRIVGRRNLWMKAETNQEPFAAGLTPQHRKRPPCLALATRAVQKTHETNPFSSCATTVPVQFQGWSGKRRMPGNPCAMMHLSPAVPFPSTPSPRGREALLKTGKVFSRTQLSFPYQHAAWITEPLEGIFRDTKKLAAQRHGTAI